MEEKSLIRKEENGIFSKIKIFFRNLFIKEKEYQNEVIEENNDKIEENSDVFASSLQDMVQNDITEEMKEEVEEKEMEKLVGNIEINKENLNKFDISTLKRITKHFDKKISALKQKLGTN